MDYPSYNETFVPRLPVPKRQGFKPFKPGVLDLTLKHVLLKLKLQDEYISALVKVRARYK